MKEQTQTTGAQEIAAQLSDTMKACLLSGGNDEFMAGMGTWIKLRALKLLDDDFQKTELGWKVYDVIKQN